MRKEDKLSGIVLDQKKLKELTVKIDYQIRMLAIQYQRLGFTYAEIAKTFNNAGLKTRNENRKYTASSVSKLIKGDNHG